MKHLCALVAAIAIALPAHTADWTGTWVGGTDALGSTAFVQVVLTADARGTLELPSEDATVPLRDIETSDSNIAFRMPTPYGEFRFAGVLKGDVVRGRLKTPMGTEAGMHFRRTGKASLPNTAYVGAYRLPNGVIITMARPGGQLRSVNTATLASTRLVPISGDRFLDAATVAKDPDAGKEIEFTRSPSGAISSLGGAPRIDLFDQENVTFKNGDLRLAGTLITPRKAGPHPAAVVVHGSGAVTRDLLLQRAQLLLRSGVAVLLYDKRGAGESDGDWRTASFEDLAGDAVAAIGYLRTRKDIDMAKTGVVGHSQAGWIIPIVADREPRIAFAIIASGGAVSPQDQELYRAEAQTRNDFTPADAEQAKQLTSLMWTYAKSGAGWDEYLKAWQAASSKPWFRRIGGPRTPDDSSWTQVRLFAAHDPLPYLKRLRVPSLVIFGVKDENVPAARAADLWRSIVPKAEVIMVPDTGHNLIVRQGDASAYAPQYVEAMSRWLRKLHIAGDPMF